MTSLLRSKLINYFSIFLIKNKVGNAQVSCKTAKDNISYRNVTKIRRRCISLHDIRIFFKKLTFINNFYIYGKFGVSIFEKRLSSTIEKKIKKSKLVRKCFASHFHCPKFFSN